MLASIQTAYSIKVFGDSAAHSFILYNFISKYFTAWCSCRSTKAHVLASKIALAQLQTIS